MESLKCIFEVEFLNALESAHDWINGNVLLYISICKLSQ